MEEEQSELIPLYAVGGPTPAQKEISVPVTTDRPLLDVTLVVAPPETTSWEMDDVDASFSNLTLWLQDDGDMVVRLPARAFLAS